MKKDTIQAKLCELKTIYDCGNNEQLCHKAYVNNALIEIDPAIVEQDIASRIVVPLSQEEKTFIKANSNRISLNQISKELKRAAYTIKIYMEAHDLPRFHRHRLDLKNSLPEIIKNNEFFDVDKVGDKTWIV